VTHLSKLISTPIGRPQERSQSVNAARKARAPQCAWFLNLRIAGIWACDKQWSDIEELKHSTPDRVSPESLNGA
jgi:hypothetical protein